MKRQACQLSLIIAAAAAAPAALAGADIVKCVDPAGHVTLTDQPCEAGSAAMPVQTPPSMTAEPAADNGAAPLPAQAQPLALERFTAPRALPPRAKWRPPASKPTPPLARDVATLKAARLQLMTIDGTRPHQPRLADVN